MKPLDEAPCGPASFHQLDVEVERILPFGLVELRLPVLIEPASTESIGRCRQEGDVLAPAGLAAQADAVDAGGAVGHLAGRISDEVPGGRVGHLEPCLFDQVLTVHDHRAFAVEGCRIELAVFARQARTDGRQEIVDIVIGAEIAERQQPALLGPDRNLIGADRHDVVLAALGGHVGCDAFTQDVFFERDPFDGDVRVFSR